MATVLNLFMAIFLVLVIGLFAFELSRYLLARDELKTNVEVAALCCETTLVSSGDPTSSTNQSTAQSTALKLFQQNSILGQTMSNAALASSSTLDPLPGQAQIYFQFLDPITKQPVTGSTGTLIKATGAYSYTPVFGRFIGLGNVQFTFQVSSLSGVPKIDLIIAYDISGPMDDTTPITLVQRYQDAGGTDYLIPPNPNNNNQPAQGPMNTILCNVSNNGNQTPNVLPPQQLENTGNVTQCQVLKFSETPGASTQNLRGYNGNSSSASNTGCPPGNYCPSTSSSTSTTTTGGTTTGGTTTGTTTTGTGTTGTGTTGTTTTTTTTSTTGTTSTGGTTTASGIGYTPNPIGPLGPGQAFFAPNENWPEIVPNADLKEICTKIDKHTRTNDLGQLDDRLSTIAFVPQLYAFQVGVTSTTLSGLPYTSSAYTPSTSSSGTGVTPVNQYVSVNGCTYGGGSHSAGDSKPVGPNPTISGQCVNNVSPVSYGPAQAAYTDIVGNLDDNNAFVSFGSSGYSFSCIGALVEAARGNLESTANANAAGVDLTYINVTPQAGYAAYYYQSLRSIMQPMNVLANGVISFINEVASVSDVHFGFIAFNDNVGSGPGSVSANIPNISNWFLYLSPNASGSMSINSTHPLPNIQLNPASGSANNNQATIIATLPTLDVWGERDVGLALQTALGEFKNNGYARAGANQAIVLVTCGPPNEGDTSSALSSALTQARAANTAGIPIYCVSVALSSSDDSAEDNAYNDSSNGIAAVSGHGAKYYRVDYTDATTAQAQLVTVFGNIARQLVTVVQQ